MTDMKKASLLLILATLFFSCNKDDDANTDFEMVGAQMILEWELPKPGSSGLFGETKNVSKAFLDNLVEPAFASPEEYQSIDFIYKFIQKITSLLIVDIIVNLWWA